MLPVEWHQWPWMSHT